MLSFMRVSSLLENQLREMLVDFYERVFADVMIGYLFKDKDKERLIQKEWELMLQHLDSKRSYTGRPMHDVHWRLKIQGGHFDRRLQILKDCLRDHSIANEVTEKILEQAESLREMVTRNPQGECI